MSDMMLPRRSRLLFWLEVDENSTIFFGVAGFAGSDPWWWIGLGNSLTRSTWAPLVNEDDILKGDILLGDGLTRLLLGDEPTTRSPLRIFLIASVELSLDKTPFEGAVTFEVELVDWASLKVISSPVFRCSEGRWIPLLLFRGVTGALTLFLFSSFFRFSFSSSLSLSRGLSLTFLEEWRSLSFLCCRSSLDLSSFRFSGLLSDAVVVVAVVVDVVVVLSSDFLVDFLTSSLPLDFGLLLLLFSFFFGTRSVKSSSSSESEIRRFFFFFIGLTFADDPDVDPLPATDPSRSAFELFSFSDPDPHSFFRIVGFSTGTSVGLGSFS